MSLARRILPGKTYHIVRRTTERMFFLKPCETTRFVILYCIAEAALRYGILVHAVCVMSNHIHMVVTDMHRKLPRFAHLLFNQLAKAINVHWGHTECVFARNRRYDYDELVTHEAIVKQIAYILANPASAGLVETSAEWPGFITAESDLVTGKVYIGNVGKNPYLARRAAKELELKIVPPPNTGDPEAFAAEVQAMKLALEAQARADRKEKGLRVLGRSALLAQKWYERPKTGETIRKRNPVITAVLAEARVAAIVELQHWRRAYAKALLEYRNGNRDVLFPAGTWMMHEFFKVGIAPPAAAA
jgi:putative transposase